MNMRAWLAIATLAATLLLAGRAEAQGYGPGYYPGAPPPPPRGIIRSGLVFGFGIGLGAISFTDCDDCEVLGGLGLEGHIGGMIAPNLALLFDAAVVVHPLDDGRGGTSSLASITYMGVLRGWVSRIFWLQGGLGGGYMSLGDEYGTIATSEMGFGVLLGAGIELVQSTSFALDLQLRISASRYDYGDGVGVANTVLQVGLNWY
jgi:hypothetical protein